jgi:hypothetical protein
VFGISPASRGPGFLFATVVFGLVVFAVIAGCSGSSAGKRQKVDPGDTIYVEGKISLRGSLPFPLLLLEAKDGVIYMIDSSPKAEELKRLDEMSVGVTAKVLPEIGGEAPALSVVSYDLLPLSSGEKPVIGVVVIVSMEEIALQADDGSRWIIEGEFKPTFMGMAGARIWIVGDRRYAVNTERADIRMVNVTQYGVIREAY